jgi:soluble lytic murein transglycosylase-like protein/ribose 5-phosphate isomerase RpiB
MTATVVDQLIVKLGLDPKDFTKGEKEVAASVLRTKKSVTEGMGAVSDEAGKAAKSFASSGGVIARVASKAGPIGIALAAIGVGAKLAADKILDIAENVRALGLTARNFDESAAGLRNVQNAAELAGGTMEDATSSVGGLKKALFDLKFNGQVSESIVALARLGVNPNQSYDKVAGDAAEALDKGQKNGTFTPGEAIFYAQQAGFQGGLAQLVASGGRGGVEAALAKQAARRQVTAADFATATDVVTSSQSKGQAAFAELGLRGLAAGGGIQADANRGVESAITGVGHASEYVTEALDKLGGKINDVIERAPSAGRQILDALDPRHSQKYYQRQIDKTAAKYGIESQVLAGVLRTESGFNPNAVNKDSGARGIAQLLPKYFPNAGKDANADIDTAGGELRRLHDSFLNDGNDSDASWFLALQGYNAGRSRVLHSANNGGTGKPLTAETLAYPGKVLASPGAQGSATRGGSSSTVQIDSITVNTQATDADGIAGDLDAAIDRKMTAANAEPGQQ